MSEKKLSPRQKMINMMYLVLTALLALNVSAEILNAFVLVDESLIKTAENMVSKNEAVYSSFNKLNEQFPVKTKPWKDKADVIKVQAQELVDYMTALQNEIVKKGDGSDELYKKNGPVAVQKKDENNIPGEIMILNKKGLDLKKKIDLFRELLVGYSEGSETIVKALKSSLSTEKIKSNEGSLKAWDEANFEHLPLSAVLTMLSKMKTDVRNAEGDVIAYLFSKVGGDEMKVNKIKAIVNSPVNYVLVGEKYQAQIFIAAYDSTQEPEVVLDGGTKLPIENGMGIYNGPTGAPGMRTYKGVVNLKLPSGEIKAYDFKGEYQVAVPSVSVSPTKMNVFYIGVDNPVDITAAGVASDKVNASISAGSIVKDGKGGYIVKVKTPGTVRVSVTASGKSLGTKEFRVKTVPSPVTTIGSDQTNWKGGVMDKTTLIALSGVNATMENFDFQLTFNVTQFIVSATIDGFDEEVKSTSRSFTPQQKQLISKVGKNKKVIIEQVKASGPDGSVRKLNDIVLKLK